MRDKLPLEPVAQVKDEEKKQHETQFTDLNLLSDDKKKEKPVVEIYPGTGNFIDGQAARRAVGRDDKSGKYTLNFDDADLGEVAKVILSDTLGENYVLAPSVSGRVTLQTSRPLTREELVPTLEMLLRMNGVVLIKSDGGYRIEPAANALSGANSPQLGRIGQSIPDGFQIRIIPLRYIGVEEMQKILEPLLPENSIVRADKTRNLMVVAGTAAELGNLLETIEVFDVNLLQGMSVLMYPLKNIDAETMVGELQEIFGSEEENPLNGMFKLIPIERMNSVMVITPQPGYLREARVWLDRLDRNADETGAGGGVYVYRVQNIEATNLADILNGIFSEGKSGSKTPDAQVAPGSAATEIGADASNDNLSGDLSGGQSGGRSSKRSKKKSRSASASTLSIGDNQDVRIIPDEENNSLVIVASAQAYDILKKVISQLDIPPLEVLIDATIVEVTLTDDLRYGVQWFFNHSLGPYGATAVLSAGAITTHPPTSTGTPPTQPAPPGGFSYSITDSASTIRAILTALAMKNKANVVASPSLMVLNNQEAKITVGDQIPFQSGAVTNLASGGGNLNNSNLTTQIQQRQTGVTLEIKPRVNA
ncbi:MAG: type II secretion system secretin GspD, partial [Methylococcales bacterium]